MSLLCLSYGLRHLCCVRFNRYAVCHHAESHNAEFMLSVVMLNVIMLSVVSAERLFTNVMLIVVC
jgi:hypothetical protein